MRLINSDNQGLRDQILLDNLEMQAGIYQAQLNGIQPQYRKYEWYKTIQESLIEISKQIAYLEHKYNHK